MTTTTPVRIPTADATVDGDLTVPSSALGIVVFAHGSGSSRHSPRNRRVALTLQDAGLGTLLMDLFTPDEEARDMRTAELRFDIGLLSGRLVDAVDWLSYEHELPLGTFGASTGAAAALIAAAERPAVVRAVVSRGGRPDLADAALERVAAPTLLIVGERDEYVIELNRHAERRLKSECVIEIVPSATHLFEEPGALEEVARLSAEWFTRHLI